MKRNLETREFYGGIANEISLFIYHLKRYPSNLSNLEAIFISLFLFEYAFKQGISKDYISSASNIYNRLIDDYLFDTNRWHLRAGTYYNSNNYSCEINDVLDEMPTMLDKFLFYQITLTCGILAETIAWSENIEFDSKKIAMKILESSSEIQSSITSGIMNIKLYKDIDEERILNNINITMREIENFDHFKKTIKDLKEVLKNNELLVAESIDQVDIIFNNNIIYQSIKAKDLKTEFEFLFSWYKDEKSAKTTLYFRDSLKTGRPYIKEGTFENMIYERYIQESIISIVAWKEMEFTNNINELNKSLPQCPYIVVGNKRKWKVRFGKRKSAEAKFLTDFDNWKRKVIAVFDDLKTFLEPYRKHKKLLAKSEFEKAYKKHLEVIIPEIEIRNNQIYLENEFECNSTIIDKKGKLKTL